MTTLVVVPEGGNSSDVLAQRYRAAFDKMKAGREQWIEGTLELAVIVAEARRQFPDHRAFSQWIERNGLQKLNKDQRAGLVGLASMGAQAAREILTQTRSWSWDLIWKNRPNKQNDTLRSSPKGRPSHPPSRTSGWAKRQRLPDVMREDNESLAPSPSNSWARSTRPTVDLQGLTREQVDPDFKGTSNEFLTKYGHVNLHTKQEIKRNKRHDALSTWLSAVHEFERTGRAMVKAFAEVEADPLALHEWTAKPGKIAKLQAWSDSVKASYDRLRAIISAAQ